MLDCPYMALRVCLDYHRVHDAFILCATYVPNSILTVPMKVTPLLESRLPARFPPLEVLASHCVRVGLLRRSHPLLTNLCAFLPVSSIEGTAPATRKRERNLNGHGSIT